MICCGLLTCSKQPVSLRSIAVDVAIRGFVADVASELHYRNEEPGPVEAVFVFPLDADAAVYAFEALVGGKRIEAQLQEKKQAQECYEDALSQGHGAFLLEEDEASDIFSCSLGNLPPGGEAVLTLRYAQALPPEPDGACRFLLPGVLNPRYTPHDSAGGSITQEIPRAPQGQLPYTLSLSATLESPYGIARVHSDCALTPLRYTAGDNTAAQVSLAEGHQFDRDVELLVYYEEVHRPSALLESGKAGAEPGSFMGDPVLLLTLYPSFPAAALGPSNTGEFLFLMDRSGSMADRTGSAPDSPQRIHSAKETLILLLKSLPPGCYFNIYSFGSRHESFYPQSMEYTQETVEDSLQRVKQLMADLGGTEILAPLQDIYRQTCREGHPRQLFVFTDGEVSDTDEVIAEVQHNGGSHRCFAFGIGEGASTALIKGIARAGRGSAEFITGQDRIQAKALQSLKRALQPAATGISVCWSLPPGWEGKVLGPDPKVIFQGQRCLLYARLRGQQQPPGPRAEGTVTLQYSIQDQSFTETLTFPLQPQEGARLPIHRLAAQAELRELKMSGTEDDQRRALETSLSSGVVCSQTAYVGVDTELGQPIQGPLTPQDIPLEEEQLYTALRSRFLKIPAKMRASSSSSDDMDEPKESPLMSLVSLQNVNGSWALNAALAALLGLTEAEARGKMPAQVSLGTWATVLAVLWLHARAAGQRDEWELLEAKAQGWLRANVEPQLAECVDAANSLLGCSVSPSLFGL